MTHENDGPGHGVQPDSASGLPLIAAMAAVSFEAALAKRPANPKPVQALSSLLANDETLLESAKKALARLAVAKGHLPATAAATMDRAHEGHGPSSIAKLTVAAREGFADLDPNDLAELRDFCVRVSMWARVPRATPLLKLR